jgi:hypothetical protein
MTVDIELFGQLASGEQRRQTLTLETPMPVYDVAILIGVNPEEVGLQSLMQDEVPLTCRLCFFPPMTGG